MGWENYGTHAITDHTHWNIVHLTLVETWLKQCMTLAMHAARLQRLCDITPLSLCIDVVYMTWQLNT